MKFNSKENIIYIVKKQNKKKKSFSHKLYGLQKIDIKQIGGFLCKNKSSNIVKKGE